MTSKPSARGRRGLRLGKYELSSPARSWDKGAAYQAVDVERSRAVSVKILPAEFAANPALGQRLINDVAKAVKLRHPNILEVLEAAEADGTWYLALEWVEGDFLVDRVQKQGPLSAKLALRLITQAARSLNHACEKDVLPPDASPFGFLVSRHNHIKLVPIALLLEVREKDADAAVAADYSAPEHQRRDNRERDFCSAIYSLGGALYFMLTGRHPGAAIGYVDADPPELVTVMRRMLEKRPEQRYQTPGELLKELESFAEPEEEEEATSAVDLRTAPAALAGESDEDSFAGSDDARDEFPEQGPEPETPAQPVEEEPVEPVSKSAPMGKKVPAKVGFDWSSPQVLIMTMAALIVMLGLVVVILALRSPGERTTPVDPNARVQAKDKDLGTKPDANRKKEEDPKQVAEQKPLLLDTDKLAKEFAGPWPPEQVKKLPPQFYVGRGFDEGKGVFRSLGEACAAAPASVLTVIEIHDNGPFFEMPIAVTGRSLEIRAAPGYRPLLVWDLEKWKDRKPAKQDGPATFISVRRGNLKLFGVDLALDWPAKASGPACLVRVAEGDFFTWNSTFSVAGKHKAGVALIRFEAEAGKRCRLSNCFGRGANLIALDLHGTGPEVMLDQCIMVGGDQPLIRSEARTAGTQVPTVRLVRSTLLASKDLFQVAAAEAKPAQRFMCWDTLLVRLGNKAGGTLLDLPPEAGSDAIDWRGYNCLYGGWKTLLAGKDSISAGAAWSKHWSSSEADRFVTEAWDLPADPAEMPLVSSEATPFLYPATFGPGALGCDLAELVRVGMWTRSNWRDLAYRGFTVPSVPVLKDSAAPEIPESKDGLYHGGRLNVTKKDIADHLREIQKKQQLAPHVVLHLAGSGKRKIKSLYLVNRSLTLYFEPPKKGQERLVLVPDGTGTDMAVFQMLGGNLDIIDGEIRCPDTKDAKMPHYLIHMKKGTLRVHKSRLVGPLTQPPDTYWALIGLEGSGTVDHDKVYGCTLHETILETAKVGLQIFGVGSRIRIEQSVIVAGTRALYFQPGQKAPAELNVQCSLEKNTLAARDAVVYVEDVNRWAVSDPIVLKTDQNVYVNPFLAADGKAPEQASVLLCEGVALHKGVLAWQGKWDVFDPRLVGFRMVAGPDGKAPKGVKAQPYAFWENTWGAFGSREPLLNVKFKKTITLDDPQLDHLVFPKAHPFLSPGANFERLGILKK